MKKMIALALIPVLSGCLSASSPRVTQWLLEYKGPVRAAQPVKYEVARVSQVLVCSPYNEMGIAVLRADGSMAFDPYNEYAANPTALLKGFVYDAMGASGLFGTVVNPRSSVKSQVMSEVLVTRLALDCRKEGKRKAVAAVRVRLIADDGKSLSAQSEGEADAKDGNYGKALSSALSFALNSALGQFR